MTAMEQPFAAAPDASEDEGTSRRDILAMLCMLDYLIVQTSAIDAVSARCLILARDSLASSADRASNLH